MKLAFITVAASLLGGALVAASTSADGQITTKLQDRAPMAERVETVRVVDVSCAGAPGARTSATRFLRSFRTGGAGRGGSSHAPLTARFRERARSAPQARPFTRVNARNDP